MENLIIEVRKEIIEWVKNLDDLEIIQELLDLKNDNNSSTKFSEPSAQYAIKDDFDEKFAKGIPHQEMKRRTIEHIGSLPWKQ